MHGLQRSVAPVRHRHGIDRDRRIGIVVATVAVYNDFVNPLYFLPGTENATVQLTLFNFQSQFNTRWNLLSADVLLITIPPLIAFILFQRQIVSGMTAGAVKG